MAHQSPSGEDDPAVLVAAVLDEEARRDAQQRARTGETVLPDDLLPGVGGRGMALGEVLRAGGTRTILVLAVVNMFEYFDRGAIQVLAPDIQRTLGISDSLIGALAAMSGLFLVLGAIPLGYLADRMRRTLLAALSSVVFAGFQFLTGLVTSPITLAGTRVGTGLGQANIVPVHNALIADAYPIEGRARVFALHAMSGPMGLLLGPLVAGAIASIAGGNEGWRWAFFVLAIPSLAAALTVLTVREPRRGQNEKQAVLGSAEAEADEAPISLAAAFTRLKKVRSFYFFLVGLAALGFALFSVPIFLGLFLKNHYHLEAFRRGTVLSLTQVGSLVGAIVAGSAGDRLFRRSPPRAVLLMGAAIVGYGLVTVLALYMPNVVLLTVVMAIAQGCAIAAFVNANKLIASVVPYRLRSQGYAMIGLYLFLFGALFGAILTGSLASAHGERVALSIVVPPAALVGGLLISYGSRFVRRDISLVVEELLEEQEEQHRVAAGGEVPVLQVRNLDFSYGQVQVLFDVDLDVYRGEVLALLGTNGAGKSTLLRAVSGLALPDRGVVRLNGRTITYADAETRVGMGIVQVPGGKAIFPTLTVAENLLAGAYTYIWERERLAARAGEVLELFPVLAERMDQAAGTLSGGEQQMLALAKALLLDPEILLVDELSLGLAPVVVQEILQTVERLKERGITMVIVEQSVNVALSIAERAVFMEKGQVRFEGPAADLLERDDLVRAVFLAGAGAER